MFFTLRQRLVALIYGLFIVLKKNDGFIPECVCASRWDFGFGLQQEVKVNGGKKSILLSMPVVCAAACYRTDK